MGYMPLYSYENKRQYPPKKQIDANKGLWFERFFDKYNQNWQISEATDYQEDGKKAWIQSVSGQCGNADALNLINATQRKLCSDLKGKVKAFKTQWHFATGLGNNHPVENGFTWHTTLGTPYLSGASVKGLVRAYIEEWAGLEREVIKETCRVWFGSESKNINGQNKDDPSQAGAYIFFDAIPTQPIVLSCDVMTPHMGGWYAKGDSIKNASTDSDTVPADWHNPIPIPFLVVKDGSFLFSIAPRNPMNQESLEQLPLVMEALSNALEYIGAGAKTASGYGRMLLDISQNKSIEKAQKDDARNEMSAEDRFKDELMELEDKQIAEMFGKNFNKTKINSGDNWDLFLEILLVNKQALVESWKSMDKNSAGGKAYKKLKNTTGRLD